MHGCVFFGYCIAADWFAYDQSQIDAGSNNTVNGLIMLDVPISCLVCEPTRDRDTFTTKTQLRYFAQFARPQRFYSDPEEGRCAAARRYEWRRDSSKPHDSQSNGLIEACVGLMKEGART